MESATQSDATKESVLLFLNVPPGSGNKRSRTICHTPFRAFAGIAAHVLSLAL